MSGGVCPAALLAVLSCLAPAGTAPRRSRRRSRSSVRRVRHEREGRQPLHRPAGPGGSTLYFCDIGDLVAFIGRTHPKEFAAAVHDFASGEWLDAAKAFYVIDKKNYPTPMGWGIAAFRDRAAATGAPLDFEALRKALR